MKGEVILKHVSFSLKSLNDTCLIFFFFWFQLLKLQLTSLISKATIRRRELITEISCYNAGLHFKGSL